MSRVSKDPTERRQELIGAALELFVKKGYEKTSISDVVKAIDVAQGTFYYHFRSKGELLDAAVDQITAVLAEAVRAQAERDGVDELRRLGLVIRTLFEAVITNRELVRFFRQPGNEVIRDKVRRALLARLSSPLATLITSGVESGRFDAPYAQEMVSLTLAAIIHLAAMAGDGLEGEPLERLRDATILSAFRIFGASSSSDQEGL